MIYSAAVIARVRDPKYAGWLPRDAPDVGTGEAGTLDSGTMARIQIRVEESTRRIDQAVFKVFGCSAAIASASLVTERLRGAPVDRVREIDALTVVAELALPPERASVAALAVTAARHAVEDWERKHDRNL
ncbi:MAG TPA: iron-sulfur cluster assembly scaffold protein [Vicinamibacterales bacterium]|nr:iron-sulfur cluster assembly scaffold protein [Vicinamibacterales bacterium]